jgi:hypothetical protein
MKRENQTRLFWRVKLYEKTGEKNPKALEFDNLSGFSIIRNATNVTSLMLSKTTTCRLYWCTAIPKTKLPF